MKSIFGHPQQKQEENSGSGNSGGELQSDARKDPLFLKNALALAESKAATTWYSQSASSPARNPLPRNVVPPETVSIQVATLLRRIPSDLLGEGPHDPEMEIYFKFTELVGHISRRNPAILLSTVARACPKLFAINIAPELDREIYFSWHGLIGQLNDLVETCEKTVRRMPAGTAPVAKAGKKVRPSKKTDPAPAEVQPENEIAPQPDGVQEGPAQPVVGGEPGSRAIFPQSDEEKKWVEELIHERDEAVRQREAVMADFMTVKNELHETTQALETSRAGMGGNASVETLVRERDAAIKERDEARAEAARLKLALKHTTEALEAVCKTSIGEDCAA